MDNRRFEYVTLDVFTSTRFAGNPLAVVKVPRDISITQEQKQLIAREFNYSETTFLHERAEGEAQNEWTVDIFTKDMEIPFAGHPTIGTACYALGELIGGHQNDGTRGRFSIKAGAVDLHYRNKKASASIPHEVHIHKATFSDRDLCEIQPGLLAAQDIRHIKLPERSSAVSIVRGMTFPVIELPDLDTLGSLTADSRLAKLELDEGWGSIHGRCYYYVRLPDSVDGTVNLRTRMIKTGLEDPATGSAASALTSYISMTEKHSRGEKIKFLVIQGVEMGRKSEIHITITMKEEGVVGEVLLEGTAVKVMEGQVFLPPV